MSTAEILPKETDRVLRPITNTYAIMHGEVFDYYPIKLGVSKGKYVEILKLPLLLEEGFITVNKKLYLVSFRDLLRNRVNVEREFTPAARNDQSTSTSDTGNVDQITNPPNQSGFEGDSELLESELIDLAWQEQIDSLLYIEDPEEEWGMENFA